MEEGVTEQPFFSIIRSYNAVQEAIQCFPAFFILAIIVAEESQQRFVVLAGEKRLEVDGFHVCIACQPF